MKRIKIDTLEKLETFIKNEAIRIEDRLEVFAEALKQYHFHIMGVKYNDDCKKIENAEAVAGQMFRLIQDIKEAPESKFYYGFLVTYEIN